MTRVSHRHPHVDSNLTISLWSIVHSYILWQSWRFTHGLYVFYRCFALTFVFYYDFLVLATMVNAFTTWSNRWSVEFVPTARTRIRFNRWRIAVVPTARTHTRFNTWSVSVVPTVRTRNRYNTWPVTVISTVRTYSRFNTWPVTVVATTIAVQFFRAIFGTVSLPASAFSFFRAFRREYHHPV